MSLTFLCTQCSKRADEKETLIHTHKQKQETSNKHAHRVKDELVEEIEQTIAFSQVGALWRGEARVQRENEI